MKHFCITVALLAFAMLFGATNLHAHGGTYKGPQDTVPPGGTSPPPSGTPSSPVTPPTSSPPNGPVTPPNPADPAAPPSVTPPGPSKGPVVTGGQAIPQTDLTTWVYWWEFNKDRFLSLKTKIHDTGTVTEMGPLIGLGKGARGAGNLAPTEAQKASVIVPALHALIKDEDNRDIATSVMIALAKIGLNPNEVTALLEKQLGAGEQEVSETAALAYGILKDENAIPLLANLLNDSKEAQALVGKTEVPVRSRTFAAYSLGMIGRATNEESIKSEVAHILTEVLATDSSAVKDLRVACVISLGVLETTEPTVIVDTLSGFLAEAEDSPIVLAHIPNAMAKLMRKVPAGDLTRQAVVNQLLQVLEKKYKCSPLIKQSAVQSLGMLATANDPLNYELFDHLARLSKSGGDQQLKHYTAISMAYLGAADPQLRDDVTEFLVKKMQKSNTLYKPWCGLALGVMAFQLHDAGADFSPIAMEATHNAFLDNKAPQRKGAYAIAMGLMGNQAASQDILQSLVDSSDSEYRGYAAVALGLLNANQAVLVLSETVQDSKRDPGLLRQASIGLGLMKDRGAINNLLPYLKPESGKRPRLSILAAVASALGYIGDKSSVQPLVETMSNERLTPLGRAFAAVALGMVADKEVLPWNSVFSEDLNYRAAVSTLVDQTTSTGILDIL
ncbi:MAG: hypothetical protein GY747_00620 [Planctomycetes bacterium]|nr:hypothetical protein [Planctomycetota bacterium]MCP4770813.1 hypothetical protein [Planctomycetota bacterium]MCP4861353.1 hypothetical protein [Planctomycetota bacterium]